MVGKQWCANVPIWHKELPQRAEHQSIPKSIRAAPQTCRETGSCRRRRDVARFLRETKKPGFFWTSCTRKQLWERRCRSPRSWCLEKRCCSASSLLPPPPLPKLSTSLSLIHVEIPIEHLSKSPTLDFLGLSQLFQRTEGTFSEHICPLKARAVKSTGTKSWLITRKMLSRSPKSDEAIVRLPGCRGNVLLWIWNQTSGKMTGVRLTIYVASGWQRPRRPSGKWMTGFRKLW